MNRQRLQYCFVLFLALLALSLLSACDRSERAEPGPTATPAIAHNIAEQRTVQISQEGGGITAAALAPQGIIFTALKGNGLWMGVPTEQNARASYRWSREPSTPQALLTEEITALAVSKDNLWVGTRNLGLYQLQMGDQWQWQNYNRENSVLPTNTINRIKIDLYGLMVATTGGGVIGVEGDPKKWRIITMADGLPSNNVLDMGAWFGYVSGGLVLATDAGVAEFDSGKYLPSTGSIFCRFEHVTRIYGIIQPLFVVSEQPTNNSKSGWRPVRICESSIFISSKHWNGLGLTKAAYPNAQIANLMKDRSLWITFAPDEAHPQGALARYDNPVWTGYRLPTDFSSTLHYAVMLEMGNDLWLGAVDRPFFTVLENVRSDDDAHIIPTATPVIALSLTPTAQQIDSSTTCPLFAHEQASWLVGESLPTTFDGNAELCGYGGLAQALLQHEDLWARTTPGVAAGVFSGTATLPLFQQVGASLGLALHKDFREIEPEITQKIELRHPDQALALLANFIKAKNDFKEWHIQYAPFPDRSGYILISRTVGAEQWVLLLDVTAQGKTILVTAQTEMKKADAVAKNLFFWLFNFEKR